MRLTPTTCPELEQAEQLLLNPTAENLDQVTTLFSSLAERVSHSAIPLDRSCLSRIGVLLQGALQLRLGLARSSVAGLAGYSPDGRTSDSASFGSSPPLATI